MNPFLFMMEPRAGFEPATPGLPSRCPNRTRLPRPIIMSGRENLFLNSWGDISFILFDDAVSAACRVLKRRDVRGIKRKVHERESQNKN